MPSSLTNPAATPEQDTTPLRNEQSTSPAATVSPKPQQVSGRIDPNRGTVRLDNGLSIAMQLSDGYQRPCRRSSSQPSLPSFATFIPQTPLAPWAPSPAPEAPPVVADEVTPAEESARTGPIITIEVDPISAQRWRNAVAPLLNRSPYDYPENLEQNISAAVRAAHSLPQSAALRALRLPNGPAAMVIRNVPVESERDLPETPAGGQRSDKATFLSEWSLLGLTGVVGDVMAYQGLKQGNIINNVCPVSGQETSQSNEGSKVDFGYHRETAFSPIGPDYVALICVRHDPKAATTVVCSQDALESLSASDKALLRQPVFQTLAPEAFKRAHKEKSWSEPGPVLSGPDSSPELCLNLQSTRSLDPKSQQALNRLVAALNQPSLQRKIYLQPGDLLIFDNRKVLHGRTNFKPRFDGKDRWLQRCYLRQELWSGRQTDQDPRTDRLFKSHLRDPGPTSASPALTHAYPQGVTPSQLQRDHQTLLEAATPGPQQQTSYDITRVVPPERYHPYPIAVTPEHFAELERFQKALSQGLQAAVNHYSDDADIQRRLELSPRVSRQLPFGKPYTIGSYRPDVLYPADGDFRICEINARFPSNGYMLTHGGNELHHKLPYLEGTGTLPLPSLDKIPNIFLETFSKDKEVLILRGREKGLDVHVVEELLTQKGYRVRSVTPEDLRCSDDGVLCDAQGGSIEQVFLELHQSEIEGLDDSVFEALANVPTSLNDLRTIFMAHDKRMLSVLSSRSIMERYLSPEHVELLQSHVIPTNVLSNLSPQDLDDVLNNREKWVIKPNLLGKGAGVLLGASCTKEAWSEAVSSTDHADYVIQPFIEQEAIAVRSPDKDVTTDMHVVGLMHCHNDNFYGPGLYRASTDPVINVSTGGAVMFPGLLPSSEG